MNDRQKAFYDQARSDWSVFCHFHSPSFRGSSAMRRSRRGIFRSQVFLLPPCHKLHYLQMCTEKLAKAYYQTDPRGGHAAFREFINVLPSNPLAVSPLGFKDLGRLTRWQGSVRQIVAAIEDLAPSIADRKNLPNPEYPWPRGAEITAPANYPFKIEVFDRLSIQARSGEPRFLTILARMVATMQTAAWHL